MKQMLLLIVTGLFLSCSAGDKQGDTHIYWINSTLASCVGMAPTKCLQVQKSETMDPSGWKSFHASIKGFEYEPGYFYKLVVKEHAPDPADLPADASSIEYSLVEILEKRQDMKFRINDSWELLKINEVNLEAGLEGISAPLLEINAGEMRYLGNDGCNNFTGGIIELDDQRIRFGIAAGTRMMCQDMTIPDLFNRSLPEISIWQIKENKLHLLSNEGLEVMQFKRSD